jgi:hypothetical protein
MVTPPPPLGDECSDNRYFYLPVGQDRRIKWTYKITGLRALKPVNVGEKETGDSVSAEKFWIQRIFKG